MEVVAIYGRVSTQEQAREGYSLGEQEKRLRMYAEAHGWQVGACYMDAGFSGAKMERPGLQSLIDDAKYHRITKVIVYKLDRLSRSQKDTLYLIEDVFMKNGIGFASLSETLDTSTPFGIAMIGILSVFAQLERETIKERMMIGREAAIRSGKYKGITNPPPFGFRNDNGKIAPDEYEQELVRRVYDLYLEGHTKREISRIMEATAPARDTPWESIRVTRILSNPIYIGRQLWKGEEYDCTDIEPVLPMEIWNAAQFRRDKLKTGRNNHQTPNHHKSMLGGMIFCAKCGRRYAGITAKVRGTTYQYYRCEGTHAYKNAEGRCRSPHIPMNDLDEMIIAEIKKISADPSMITRSDTSAESTRARIDQIQKRIRSIESQQKKLVELYTIEAIDRSILIERSQSLASERATLERDLETASAAISRPTSFRQDIQTFNNLIESSASKQDLYQIIHSLIQSITIENKSISINWSI